MYNIYADLLLGTNIVSQTVSRFTHICGGLRLTRLQLLKGQTAFYNSLFNSGNCKYGGAEEHHDIVADLDIVLSYVK